MKSCASLGNEMFDDLAVIDGHLRSAGVSSLGVRDVAFDAWEGTRRLYQAAFRFSDGDLEILDLRHHL
jgi:hypothetical protein